MPFAFMLIPLTHLFQQFTVSRVISTGEPLAGEKDGRSLGRILLQSLSVWGKDISNQRYF